MRRRLVAANWKMHGSSAFLAEFADNFVVSERDQALDVIVFPPSVYLGAWVSLSTGVASGVQDVGISPSGAHTGEVAAEMVFDVGGRWAIVGHSERRIDQQERDDLVATKASAALRGGLRPIVCVGETLAEREAGHEIAVVERQLEAVLDRVDLAGLAQGALAYEPVWAIGTGKVATPDQANEAHTVLREALQDKKTRILYGGSVKPANAAELASQPEVNGFLVGGASLKPADFSQICNV